jgi:hypothetical protein
MTAACSIFGFIGGAIAGGISWFGTNYYGRNLKRLWDLRLEIQTALRTPDNRARLSDLASQLYGLQAVMPSLFMRFLRCDLRSAVGALESFSELRSNEGEYQIAERRVQVQKCLHLPIDPKDREMFERVRRAFGQGEPD